MRVSGHIRALPFITCLMTLLSCGSIIEDRVECPCYLDVTLPRQSGNIFTEDKAWCSTWEDESIASQTVFSPVMRNDGQQTFGVPRRPVMSVVMSNLEPEGSRLTAPSGCQMTRLYVSRRDVDCSGDLAQVTFDSFEKRFVTVKFRLNDAAMPYREQLTVTLDAPYDGLSLPSMTAHRGTFNCTSGFDENGETTLRIPPQGGPGLKTGIRLGDGPPAMLDLYRTMLDAGFDWKGEDLDDFITELGLNSVVNIIEFVDWDVVQLEDIKY